MATTLVGVDRGDVIECTCTFTNTAGTPTDPTTTTFTVMDPTGVTTTYTAPATEITHSGAGVYVLALPVTKPFVYRIRAVGTGAVAAAVTGEVYVTADRFA